jgi:chitinase
MASESENRVVFVTTNQWYAPLLNALHQVYEFVCGQLAPQGHDQR